jgi:hypothetical protein
MGSNCDCMKDNSENILPTGICFFLTSGGESCGKARASNAENLNLFASAFLRR